MGASLVALLVFGAVEVAEVNLGQLTSVDDFPAAIERALGGVALSLQDSGPQRAAEVKRVRGDAALAALGRSEKLCALTSLSIRYLTVSATGLTALAKPCLALTELMIPFTEIDDQAAVVLGAAPFAPSLRVLWANNNALTPVGLEALVPSLSALEQLRLGQNRVGPAGAAVLAKAPWPHLRVLELASNPTWKDVPIGPEGARSLAAGAFPALQELVLLGNAIGSSGAQALLESGLVGRLSRLDLEGNDVNRATAIELGTKAPQVEADFGGAPVVASAWSTARAARLRQGAVVPVDVFVAADADLRSLAGVEEIAGSLTITGDLRTLAPLARLTTLGGTLAFSGTRALTQLNGLETLSTVRGDVVFQANRALRTTAGLTALRVVGGDVVVHLFKGGNPGLAEVAFPSLERVGGALRISRGKGYLFPAVKNAAPVEVKTIRPFRKLVFVGDHSDLLEAEPALFPSLSPQPR